jgi:hypothetical protein
MKIIIHLNEGTIKRDIPVSYAEITFSTFLKLIACNKDPAKILAVFTGLEEDVIRQARLENLSNILQVLSFTDHEIQYYLPKTILGHPIPKDLEMQSIAQYEDIKKELASSESEIKTIEKYPLLIATYCVNPYTWQEAEKLAPIFFDAPCTEVMAIGNFILVKLIALKQNIKPHFRPVATLLSKFKLAMIVLVKRSAFIIRYFLWRRKLRSIERNYLPGQWPNSTII